jgi:hypothetical protein
MASEAENWHFLILRRAPNVLIDIVSKDFWSQKSFCHFRQDAALREQLRAQANINLTCRLRI